MFVLVCLINTCDTHSIHKHYIFNPDYFVEIYQSILFVFFCCYLNRRNNEVNAIVQVLYSLYYSNASF